MIIKIVSKDLMTDSSVEEMMQYCSSKAILGLDTETTGLDPHTSKIVMIQVGDEEVQFVIDARKVSESKLKPLFKIIEDKAITKVLVNAKFDYQMFLTNYNVRIRGIKDCMLQEQVLNTGRFRVPANMKAMAHKYLNVELNKEVGIEFTVLGKKPFTRQQILYGAYDVWIPLEINKFQQERLKEEGLTRVADLENAFVRCLAECQHAGFKLNEKAWKLLYLDNVQSTQEARRILEEYVFKHPDLNEFKQPSLFEKEGALTNVQWSSSRQVIPVFKKLGIPTEVLDKEAMKEKEEKVDVWKDSVEAKNLKKYEKEFEIIPLYIRYKTYEKMLSTYGEEFLKYINKKTKRVHSDFWQILDTGRMASSNPNMQNIPRDARFRDCFISEKGKDLIVADYGSQEARILADLANEDTLIDFFVNGDGDMHSLTARKMFKVEVNSTTNKHLRQIAKILNFGIAYGMSAYKLSNDFSVSLEEAQDFIDKFFEAYPKLAPYFETQKKLALERGYIVIDDTIFRKSYNTSQKKYDAAKAIVDDFRRTSRFMKEPGKLPSKVWSDFFSAKGSIERNSMNYRIQGTAASMTKVACLLIFDELEKRDWLDQVKLVNMVHDELVFESPEEFSEEVKKIVQTNMIKAGGMFCKKVPMACDPEITKIWKH